MNSWAAPDLGRLSLRLAPYARDSFERGASLAARLHAEEISPEHWLAALLEDEDCAATRAVLHAFADPETIGIEVLAQCAGIMVVGSGRTLPFSVRGVHALHTTRERAFARGAAAVEPADLFAAAEGELPAGLRERLALAPEAGASSAETEKSQGAPLAGETSSKRVSREGPLFRQYSPAALRALGASCRAAASLRRTAIGPVHLCLGSLEVDSALRDRTGLSAARLRMIASGADDDETPLPARHLPGDTRLVELLQRLPEAAETLDVLGWLLEHGTQELMALLRRQKVTTALFERCQGVFHDPPGARS